MFDRTLHRRVAESLAANPRVDDDEIAVECFDGGHVVLRGRADNPDESTQAVRTANSVDGVRTVEDQITPRLPGVRHRADARTEAAVLNALIADDPLPAERIHVHVTDGTATLTGQVDFPTLSGTLGSTADRDAAVAAAAAADAVVDVEDQLRVLA